MKNNKVDFVQFSDFVFKAEKQDLIDGELKDIFTTYLRTITHDHEIYKRRFVYLHDLLFLIGDFFKTYSNRIENQVELHKLFNKGLEKAMFYTD